MKLMWAEVKLTVNSTLQNEILLVLHISYYNSNLDKDSQTVTTINCELEAIFYLLFGGLI